MVRVDVVAFSCLKTYDPPITALSGGMVDGVDVKMVVEVGMKVLVAKYVGTEVKLDETEYTVVRQSDILAIVE